MKAAAGAGLSLTFAGLAAGGGHARYVVRARGNGVVGRLERAGYEIIAELAGGDVLIVSGPEGSLDDLERVRGVQFAVPDVKFDLETPVSQQAVETTQITAPLWENQWDKHITDVAQAHDIATGEGTSVAVIDTGIDDTHPDLGNVNVDDSVTIFDGSVDPHTGDIHGHGTHVAGIAAATGEAGVLGTAPDAELVSIRVFAFENGDLVAFFGDILMAMEYAAAVGADSANMSIGTAPIPPQENAQQYRRVMEPIAQNVTRQGTLLVGSAGNDDANLQQGGFFTLPNSLSGVTSISATGPDDLRTFYSNYGTNELALGAPGGLHGTLAASFCGIAEWLEAGMPLLRSEDPREEGDTGTLWLDEDGVPTSDPDEAVESVDCPMPEWPYPFNFVFSSVPGGGYAWFAGTSMAAPQVAGAAALVREQNPNANANQVENAIQQGADLVQGRGDPDLGAGRLNAHGALD